jgi:hypothetical protein
MESQVPGKSTLPGIFLLQALFKIFLVMINNLKYKRIYYHPNKKGRI